MLSNISLYKYDEIPTEYYGYVASTDPTYPAVAFTAPGPSNIVSLYVGTSDTPTSNAYCPYKYGVSRRYLDLEDIPASGILEHLRRVYYIRYDDTGGSFAHLTEEAATSLDFPVTHVAGFSVGSFSYFLTTQPTVYDPQASSTQLISKLSQVCHDDEYFDSYVEMRISCQSGAKDYNLVRAATVLQPGTRLASRLNVPATEHLLVAAFYGDPDSALCVYRFTDIRQRFTENILACFSNSTLPLGRQFHADVGTTAKTCIPDSLVGQTLSLFVCRIFLVI